MRILCMLGIIAFGFIQCDEADTTPGQCSTPATLRNLEGLDGCGWVFELNDGTRLEPRRLMYCGTPPLPKEVTEDPLYNFEYIDGKRVFIDYEPIADAVSICMVGDVVRITCISDRIVSNQE